MKNILFLIFFIIFLVALVTSDKYDAKLTLHKEFLSNAFDGLIKRREIIKDYKYPDFEIEKVKKSFDFSVETFFIPKEKNKKKDFEKKNNKKIISTFTENTDNYHEIHLKVSNFSFEISFANLRNLYFSNSILEMKFGFEYKDYNVTMKHLVSNLVTDVSGREINPNDYQKHTDQILQKISEGIQEEVRPIFDEYIQPKNLDLTIKSDSSPLELKEIISNFNFEEDNITIFTICETTGINQFNIEEITWVKPEVNIIEEDLEIYRNKINQESKMAVMEIGEKILNDIIIIVSQCVSNPSTFKERINKILIQINDDNLKEEIEGLEIMLNSGILSMFKIKFLKIKENYFQFEDNLIIIKIPININLYGTESKLFLEIEMKIEKINDEIITSITKLGFQEHGDQKMNLIEEDDLKKEDIKSVFGELIEEFKNEGVQLVKVVKGFLTVYSDLKFEVQFNRETQLRY